MTQTNSDKGAKHTPGEWEAKISEMTSRLWLITRKDTGLKIATSDANAALIANAPSTAAEQDEAVEIIKVIRAAYGRTDDLASYILALAMKDGIAFLKRLENKDE